MKSLLKYLPFISVAFLFSCAKGDDPTLKSLMLDRLAKKQIELKQPENATQSYFQILERNPNLPPVHSNLGVLFMEAKKNEEALKSLQEALKLAEEQKDLAAQFAIRYNLGVYYGSQQKVPDALENYQAALEINPTSIETKHNIELLIQSHKNNQSKDGNKNNDQQNKDGQSKDQKNKDGKDDKDKKDQKDQDKKDKDNPDQDKKDQDSKDKDKDKMQNSPQYKPRPFKGDQLSEGDVKKILGELKNQEQKIRANFEKKERKDSKNEKDW